MARWLAATALVTAGCAGDRPRDRLGCLPFPAPLTFFELADPQELGTHRYNGGWLGRSDEEARGIVYTCRAGFLDLAHVRETVDWASFMTWSVEPALREGRRQITIDGRELTRYHLTFEYPEFWTQLDDRQREELIGELGLRIGQQLAYVVLTWHEMITWFGYKSWAVILTDRSAFTHEDIMSHVVGLRVAARVLSSPFDDYDLAVTEALAAELDDLQVASRDDADEAIRRVEGRWWADDRPMVRFLDIGLQTRHVVPWLVVDLAGCAPATPEHFPLPELGDVGGYDCRSIYKVELESGIHELPRIRALFTPEPERFQPAEHFPVIIEHIRQEASGSNVQEPPDGARPSPDQAARPTGRPGGRDAT